MELEGKSIAFLGDSITEGVGVEDIPNCRYDNRLKQLLNLKKIYNYGISGTRIAHQSTPSEIPRYDLCFCGRAYDLNPEVDVIVVYGGVNDWIHGDAFFGKMTDNTPETFCGGVEFLMSLLKTEYPKAQIVFMTPAHASHDELLDAKPSTRLMKKSDAKPLCEYVNVIVTKGKQHQIPVLDLYHSLGIDSNDPIQKKKYTADGLHFNDLGHEILAEHLARFLKSL